MLDRLYANAPDSRHPEPVHGPEGRGVVVGLAAMVLLALAFLASCAPASQFGHLAVHDGRANGPDRSLVSLVDAPGVDEGEGRN